MNVTRRILQKYGIPKDSILFIFGGNSVYLRA
jgi:hypothetical protein